MLRGVPMGRPPLPIQVWSSWPRVWRVRMLGSTWGSYGSDVQVRAIRADGRNERARRAVGSRGAEVRERVVGVALAAAFPLGLRPGPALLKTGKRRLPVGGCGAGAS